MTVRDGIDVAAKVTPGARRPFVGGAWRGPDGLRRLTVGVRERAVDGAATAAAEAALAEAFGIATSAVSLTRGRTSRLKVFFLRGDPRLLAARLEILLRGGEDETG